VAKKPKTKAQQIARWLERIAHGEAVREDFAEKFGYHRSQRMYQNDFHQIESFISGVPLIPINEVYSFTKAFIPSVFARNPHIAVAPKGAKAIAAAKILELSTNSYWRDLRLKRITKQIIMDAVRSS